jgi:transcriptional regulator with XRE-family HTH domain
MLTIRITGDNLQTARRLLGWSLQETASRSGANWLTLRKYEAAGDFHPSATVGALNRLVDALEDAGGRFDAIDTAGIVVRAECGVDVGWLAAVLRVVKGLS